jgi:meiotically up-regulated gene 157 (Mug157) protein
VERRSLWPWPRARCAAQWDEARRATLAKMFELCYANTIDTTVLDKQARGAPADFL